MMKEHYSRRRQVLKFVMFLFCIVGVLSVSTERLNAQQKDYHVDTVEMEVIISAYTSDDLKNSKPDLINQKFVVEPKSKGFDLTRLLKRNYKPNFNGVFIINDEQLVQYGVVMKKARGFKSTKDPIKTRRLKKFKPVPEGVSGAKYFYGLAVKARWLKYEIKNFDPIEMPQKKLYERNTSNHNGTYNFYVIDKVKHSRTIYR